MTGLHSPSGVGWRLHFPVESLERIAAQAGRHYSPFDRRDSKRPKWRHIDNPTGVLKTIQKRIQRLILDDVPVPETMFGAVRGRSVVDHARPHCGQPEVVTLDLRDCFPRTSFETVFQVFVDVVGCSRAVAGLLTRLCTFQGRVPQGAPTSPAIVNLSLLDLHKAVSSIAAERGLASSFYVDDIAVSGPGAHEAIEEIVGVVMRKGHSAPRRKIRRSRDYDRQTMTGLVTNLRPSVGQRRVRALRQRIFSLGHDREPFDHELQSVRGAISQVKFVNPTQGAGLEQLAERLLPDVGVQAAKPPSFEIRRCTHRRRHRRRQSGGRSRP